MLRTSLRALWEFIIRRHAEVSAICDIVTVCGLLAAGAWAYSTFQHERARFRVGILVQAYQAFYENPRHRLVRHSLDVEGPIGQRLESLVSGTPTIRKATKGSLEINDATRTSLAESSRREPDARTGENPDDEELVEWFDDYLNFFEFIAWLNQTGQLDDSSVNGMFDYYITCLSRHPWVCNYIENPANGYEFLRVILTARRLKNDLSMRTMRVFVYGTLRRDCCPEINSRFFANAAYEGHGVVDGELLDLGDYPGLVKPTQPGRQVRGEIWKIVAGRGTFDELDNYEGCGFDDTRPFEFVREIHPVTMDDGTVKACFVYRFAGDVGNANVIESGDYRLRLIERSGTRIQGE